MSDSNTPACARRAAAASDTAFKGICLENSAGGGIGIAGEPAGNGAVSINKPTSPRGTTADQAKAKLSGNAGGMIDAK